MSQRIPVKELTDSFRGRAVGALADDQLRTNFRVAMDSLMKKRADAFPDEEEREGLRELGNHIKAQLHYVCRQSFADPRGCASHRAELQTQLWF